MKISIRFSILTILLSLLLGVSLTIIGVNYFELDSILIKTAETSLTHACGKISEQIAGYILPLDRRAYIGSYLIQKHVNEPATTEKFLNLLHLMLIENSSGLAEVFWGDESGNVIFLGKNDDNTFTGINMVPASGSIGKTVETRYDPDMRQIAKKEIVGINYDPRLRPWYQQAKFFKKNRWMVYPILTYGSDKPGMLGLVSAYPVYEKGKLRGVFGLDMPLSAISGYIDKITITKNSVVFVCDDYARLISAYVSGVKLIGGYRMPSLDDLKLPWVSNSFAIYEQKKEPIFSFKFDNKEYIAAYEEIPSLDRDQPWLVAVITPVSDVIAPLLRNILFSLLAIAGALAIGIFYRQV